MLYNDLMIILSASIFDRLISASSLSIAMSLWYNAVIVDASKILVIKYVDIDVVFVVVVVIIEEEEEEEEEEDDDCLRSI